MINDGGFVAGTLASRRMGRRRKPIFKHLIYMQYAI